MVIFIRYIRGQTLAIALLLLVSVTLVACGGGGSDTPIATQAPSVPAADQNPLAQRPQAATTASAKALAASATLPTNPGPYGGVDKADAVAQLLDFAEAKYPQYFPGHKTTQTFQQYSYRYYPETGRYVGVAVQLSNDNSTVEGGVYVLGGDFGVVPTYVGMLTNFITPYAVLHYSDKVYATWVDKYPYAVTRTGVIRVSNKTQWSLPSNDLFLCFIANHPLSDGKILTLCKDSVGLKWHLLYIDPIKEELREYPSAPPSDLVYTVTPQGGVDAATFGSAWLDVDKLDPAYPNWYHYAKVSEGYYFTDLSDYGSKLWFLNNSGITSFVGEDPSGRGIVPIQVLKSYNN